MTGAARLQVAQVAPYYPPHLGGVERVAQTLAQLLDREHDVTVVTTTCGSEGAPRRSALDGDGGGRVHRHRGVEVAHTPVSPGFALHVLRLPRRTVVHAHVAQALLPEVLLARRLLRRADYVVHFHLDVDPSGRLGRVLPLYKRRVLGPALRRAGLVVVLSDEQRRFVATEYGVASERTLVLPNGVAPEFFSVAASPRGTSGRLRLLFVGRLDAQKNVGRLLDAVAQATCDVELVVVGEGEQRPQLTEQIARLGLTCVRLVGAHRGEALLAWYAWADLLVSSSDREGMPLVLLEAMAAGLPVLSTDVPGSRELVTGVGHLVPATAAGLAAGIDALAGDRRTLAVLAAASTRASRQHSWEAHLPVLQEAYARVRVTGRPGLRVRWRRYLSARAAAPKAPKPGLADPSARRSP